MYTCIYILFRIFIEKMVLFVLPLRLGLRHIFHRTPSGCGYTPAAWLRSQRAVGQNGYIWEQEEFI